MVADRSAPSVRRRLFTGLTWLPVVGVVAVPAIVVPAVLWARWTFLRLHPDADPNTYLTISRAISDPSIGEPFAFWVGIAAVLLWVSTHWVLWTLIAQHPRRPAIGVGRDRVARALWGVMSLAMTATCIGMVMLSRFRLGTGGDGGRLHMVGSYLFFGAQAATIFFVAVYHSLIGPARRAEAADAFFPDRWRARAGYAVVAAAVVYGIVFRVKSMDLGPITRSIVSVYVEFETALIVVFLAYLAAFVVDTHRFSKALRERVTAAPRGADPALDDPA